MKKCKNIYDLVTFKVLILLLSLLRDNLSFGGLFNQSIGNTRYYMQYKDINNLQRIPKVKLVKIYQNH